MRNLKRNFLKRKLEEEEEIHSFRAY